MYWKQRHYFANKGLYSQSYGFSNSHVCTWEMDHKECWTPKNRCFWTALLERTLESSLDCKEITLVNLKGKKSLIFIRRTDADAPILWPLDAKPTSIEMTLMLGKIEGRRRAEDEMVVWCHWLNGHEFGQDLVDGKDREARCSAVHSMGSQRVGHNRVKE